MKEFFNIVLFLESYENRFYLYILQHFVYVFILVMIYV
jgi:hypothetical protein